MGSPIITNFGPTPQTVAPGGTVTGTVAAIDPDNRTTYVRAQIGSATAIMTLTVEDEAVPAPTFTEVDAAGDPVATPTLQLDVDPQDPFKVHVTALEL